MENFLKQKMYSDEQVEKTSLLFFLMHLHLFPSPSHKINIQRKIVCKFILTLKISNFLFVSE